MNEYVVYSTNPSLLETVGEVYYPRIRMSFVLLKTELTLHEVRQLEGVYEARTSREGQLLPLLPDENKGEA